MFCKNCGSELRDGQSFCSACGTQAAQPMQEQPTPAPAVEPAPAQYGCQQPMQPQPTYQQVQTQNYKKLGGYLLVLTILLLIGAIANIISVISNISTLSSVYKYFKYLPGAFTTGMIILLIGTIIIALGLILTAVLILMKKRAAIAVYGAAKAIDIILTIVAIILIGICVGKYGLRFTDYFSVGSFISLALNIGFFIANMLYFLKSERVKVYFEQ